MTNNDVVDRNKILGSATQDFGFDKVLRGYDINGSSATNGARLFGLAQM